jgi:hypothetical protein
VTPELDSPLTVTLSGTGADFTLATDSGDSGTSATVSAGATATYPMSLTGGTGFSGKVALTCSGAPTDATCTVSPASVTLSGSTAATATVSVTTTARSSLLVPAGERRENMRWKMFLAPGTFSLAAFILVGVLFGMYLRRERRFAFATLLTVLLVVIGGAMSGCGGGSNSGGSSPSGPSGATGTAAGNYTITVTATAGSGANAVSHTTKLTLTVQ